MNKTTKKLLGVVAVATLISGTYVATNAQAAAKEVTIAFQSPLTGPNAGLGQDELLGVKTALWEYNQTNPKIKINLLTADDESAPSKASGVSLGVAQNPAVIGVIGSCCSGATQASFAAYKAGRLTMISPSATRADLSDPKAKTNGFPFFHRMSATDAVQAPALARYATKANGTSSKVYVIDDASSYGAGLKDILIPSLSGKGTIVGKDTVAQGAIDYSATATKVKGSGANVVIYCGYYADAAKLKIALDSAGFSGVFASGDGTADLGFIEDAGKADAEGAIFTSQSVPFELTAPAQVLKNFTTATGVASAAGHQYVTQSYDATNAFITCIKNGALTRASVQSCVATGTFKGVAGTNFSFTRYGDIAQGAPVGAYVVKNGTIIPVGAA